MTAKQVGQSAARVVFRKRGDHSEAHLSEAELAGIVEAAVTLVLLKHVCPEPARTLAFALKGLYEDQVSYLTLNKLGGMDNHWMRASRIALADYEQEIRMEQPP